MDEIELINAPITRQRLKEIAEKRFGDMVKGVVDIEKEIIALGGELHADEEAYLLENGSLQRNLWGINLYPDMQMPEFLEYDSMINVRPSQNNRSRGVDNPSIRRQIESIVRKLIP
jgi:hypothetical protein